MRITTAKNILIGHWDGNIPVNLVKIAMAMHIDVNSVTDCHYSAMVSNHNNCDTINYNSKDSILRQRFAIAHALGHLALGCTNNEVVITTDNFNANTSSPSDAKTNNFAVELLMPELAVKHLIFTRKITSLDKLSALFSVSGVLVQRRLEMLGLLA